MEDLKGLVKDTIERINKLSKAYEKLQDQYDSILDKDFTLGLRAKAVRADIMLSEIVRGLGNQALRDAKADVYLQENEEYMEYLQNDLLVRKLGGYDGRISMISRLLDTQKTVLQTLSFLAEAKE